MTISSLLRKILLGTTLLTGCVREHIIAVPAVGYDAGFSDTGVSDAGMQKPDTSAIVWTKENSVYIANADGTNQRVLIENANSPRFSPDGTKIAVAFINEGKYDIGILNREGNMLEQIAIGGNNASPGSWSKDGTAYFTSNLVNCNRNIVKADLTTSPPTVEVVYGQRKDWLSFDAHPTLDELFVEDNVCEVNRMGGSSSIRRFRTTDSPFQDPEAVLESLGDQETYRHPRISQDGKEMTYLHSRDRGITRQAWIMNVDGTGQRNLDLGDGLIGPIIKAGNHLFFTSTADDVAGYEVQRKNLVTDEIIFITDDQFPDSQVDYAPD